MRNESKLISKGWKFNKEFDTFLKKAFFPYIFIKLLS